MKIQEALQQEQQEDEEFTIVVNTTSDQSLLLQEKDFIRFPSIDGDNDPNTSESRSGSDESGLYDSDNDYSWYRRYKVV
jgi:hypothetical protein